MTLASVPELVKRTSSIDGMRSAISLASLPSFSLRPAKFQPESSALSIALRITGWEWP
jgi:hypothetical protein